MNPNPENQELIKQLHIEYSDQKNLCYESSLRCCGKMSGFLGTWICPCMCQTPYRKVEEGFVAAVQEFGKFSKLYSSGLYYINPCTEEMSLVDKRERVLDIRRQNCMTKDNVDVIVDAVVYWKKSKIPTKVYTKSTMFLSL